MDDESLQPNPPLQPLQAVEEQAPHSEPRRVEFLVNIHKLTGPHWLPLKEIYEVVVVVAHEQVSLGCHQRNPLDYE